MGRGGVSVRGLSDEELLHLLELFGSPPLAWHDRVAEALPHDRPASPSQGRPNPCPKSQAVALNLRSPLPPLRPTQSEAQSLIPNPNRPP